MTRILIVEDVEEMREMLRTFIEGLPGMKVSGLAQNGWEARLEIERRRPDLVLLDEILPGESSGDLLAELQAQGGAVLLMTGVEHPSHGIPEGARGRVSKPDGRSLTEAGPRFEAAIRAALNL